LIFIGLQMDRQPTRTAQFARRLETAQLRFLGTLIILSSAVAVDAQRSGELPMRNLVDQLARIDRDRAVDLQQ
jgi:hypothetical protein